MVKEYMTGLLEGHESAPTRYLYHFWMFAYTCLAVVGAVMGLAAIGKPEFNVGQVIMSVCILCYYFFTLFLTSRVHRDNMASTWKYVTLFVIFTTTALAVASIMLYVHSTEEPKVIIETVTVTPTEVTSTEPPTTTSVTTVDFS
jgi:uncharacterized membrane protein YhaH (DUF805 family)